jgi:transportin-1
MAGFSPDGAAVAQLLSMFELADSPSNEVQRSVMQQLDHFSSNVPEFAGYLAYIFIHAEAREPVRLRAGLALKNVIVLRLSALPQPVLEYIKETLWQGLSDSKAGVRATTASVLDWLIRSIGPSNWPEAVLRLMQFMEAENLAAREVQ